MPVAGSVATVTLARASPSGSAKAPVNSAAVKATGVSSEPAAAMAPSVGASGTGVKVSGRVVDAERAPSLTVTVRVRAAVLWSAPW